MRPKTEGATDPEGHKEWKERQNPGNGKNVGNSKHDVVRE